LVRLYVLVLDQVLVPVAVPEAGGFVLVGGEGLGVNVEGVNVVVGVSLKQL